MAKDLRAVTIPTGLTWSGPWLGKIPPIAITVTAAAKSKSVGGSDPALTYTITSGSLLGGDAATGALARDTGETAGTYAIRIGTLAFPAYYTVTYVGANLTIAALTTGTWKIVVASVSTTWTDCESVILGLGASTCGCNPGLVKTATLTMDTQVSLDGGALQSFASVPAGFLVTSAAFGIGYWFLDDWLSGLPGLVTIQVGSNSMGPTYPSTEYPGDQFNAVWSVNYTAGQTLAQIAALQPALTVDGTAAAQRAGLGSGPVWASGAYSHPA